MVDTTNGDGAGVLFNAVATTSPCFKSRVLFANDGVRGLGGGRGKPGMGPGCSTRRGEGDARHGARLQHKEAGLQHVYNAHVTSPTIHTHPRRASGAAGMPLLQAMPLRRPCPYTPAPALPFLPFLPSRHLPHPCSLACPLPPRSSTPSWSWTLDRPRVRANQRCVGLDTACERTYEQRTEFSWTGWGTVRPACAQLVLRLTLFV